MRALPLTLSLIFLKIFSRDRQAIFFSLFFPIIFMTVFGFINDGDPEPVTVGIAGNEDSAFIQAFMDSLSDNPLLELNTGDEEFLRAAVLAGDEQIAILLPEAIDPAATTELRVVVDASQVRQLSLILPVLEQSLVEVERDLRGTEPMFAIAIEDVQARSQRYIDFLVPGLLAFTLMQICIAGSGFNIVEYRRKGILKRLFVTPIYPRDFIVGIVVARGIFCLVQLSILLLLAIVMLKLEILGNYASLYLVIIAGIAIFLCLGFCIGSFAKTQQTVMALGNIVVFPQIFLSGVFYPIDALPDFIQPLASLLPLSFLVTALREIINNGLSLLAMLPDLLGLLAWGAVALFLAVRLFVWKDIAH